MNLNENNPVLITRDDYDLLKPYFTKTKTNTKTKTRTNAKTKNETPANEMSLSAELSRAAVVANEDLPADVIRLNAQVWIKDQETGAVMELTIVLPQYADIKQKKISILTPMAAALIGFRKGDSVQWKVPAGMKTFIVTEVIPPATTH